MSENLLIIGEPIQILPSTISLLGGLPAVVDLALQDAKKKLMKLLDKHSDQDLREPIYCEIETDCYSELGLPGIKLKVEIRFK